MCFLEGFPCPGMRTGSEKKKPFRKNGKIKQSTIRRIRKKILGGIATNLNGKGCFYVFTFQYVVFTFQAQKKIPFHLSPLGSAKCQEWEVPDECILRETLGN